MFSDCDSIYYIDLSDLNTGNVLDMSYMFADCDNCLMSLEFGGYFNTSSVTDMSHMFENCVSLDTLSYLDSFDTYNVILFY